MLDRSTLKHRYAVTDAQFKKAALATFGEDVETVPENYLNRFLESLLGERQKLAAFCINHKH